MAKKVAAGPGLGHLEDQQESAQLVASIRQLERKVTDHIEAFVELKRGEPREQSESDLAVEVMTELEENRFGRVLVYVTACFELDETVVEAMRDEARACGFSIADHWQENGKSHFYDNCWRRALTRISALTLASE